MGDTWSAFATTSSLPEAFRSMTVQLDRICEGIGRDPASIGRSAELSQLTVLHVDKDFELIAELTGQPRRTAEPRLTRTTRPHAAASPGSAVKSDSGMSDHVRSAARVDTEHAAQTTRSRTHPSSAE